MTGKIVAGLALFSVAMGGRGPSTPDKFTSVIAIVLGIFFVAFSLSSEARLGRRPPGVPIGSAGRLILFLIAVVMFIVGIPGLFH